METTYEPKYSTHVKSDDVKLVHGLARPEHGPKHRPVLGWRDRLGVVLSMICLVHCLTMPFVLAFLPVGAAMGFWQHGFHQFFLAVIPFVALMAFIPGWKRHRDARVWVWGTAGLILLTLGVLVAEVFGHAPAGHDVGAHLLEWSSIGDLLLTALGGACLIRAHLLNRSLCSACDHTPVGQAPSA